MKLEQQVCTLEQGKRLKVLGVVQGGYFILVNNPVQNINFIDTSSSLSDHPQLREICSAFTVAELGLMLPRSIKVDNGDKYTLRYSSCHISGDPDILYVEDSKKEKKAVLIRKCRDTEAEARAAMLIYLLENNHITSEEVNQRLTNN